MALSTDVRPMGWTRRTAARSILAAVAEQREKSAARLARALEADPRSFEEIAHEAGVSTKTISRWVNRRHDPSPRTVNGVAKALKVDSKWLWEPPPPLGLGAVLADDALPTQIGEINRKLDLLLEYFGIEADEAGHPTTRFAAAFAGRRVPPAKPARPAASKKT